MADCHRILYVLFCIARMDVVQAAAELAAWWLRRRGGEV